MLGASLALLPAALHGPVPEVVAGGWPVGMGIRLRADALSVLFCVVTNAVLAGALLCELLEGISTRSFPALVLFLARTRAPAVCVCLPRARLAGNPLHLNRTPPTRG